jgi:hypothetical protein
MMRKFIAALLLTGTLYGQETYNKYHHGLPDERVPRLQLKRENVDTIPASLDTLIAESPEIAPPQIASLAKPKIFPLQRATFFGQNVPHGTVLNPCLVAAYPMNEGSGLTLNDQSVNANTATLAATGHTWQSNSGLPGTTLLFTGGAGVLGAAAASATPTSFSNTHAFSVSFWTVTAAGVQFFLSTRNATGGTNQGWAILNANSSGSGLIQFSLVASGGNSLNAQQRNDTAYSLGVLHYIAVVYDGSSTAAGVQVYVDGVAKFMSTNVDSLSSSSASSIPLNFGQENNGTNKLSGTAMAFVEVYNCAITSGFIASSNTSGPGIY